MYESLKPALFDLIVRAGLGLGREDKVTFRVVPNVHDQNTAVTGITSASITLINEREDGGLSATHTIRIRSDMAKLTFVDFFDWGNQSYMDLRWMQVRLDAVTDRPDLNGHLAIIDSYEGDVFLEE